MINSIDELKKLIKENENFKFKIKVSANAKNNSIDFCEEYIKIKVIAPAIEGRANKAVIEFLAKNLDIAKSKVKIVNGEKASIKVIQVDL